MSHIFPEKHKCICILLFVYVITFLLVTGCERKPKLSFTDMDILDKWSRKPWPPDAKERITSAINKYKNKMVDPIPILIRAVVGKIGPEEFELYLAIFDEDEDLLGFVIREESKDPNGIVTTLEEDYPIFAHYPAVCVTNIYGGFEIFARKDGQRKDEKAWEDFLMMDFDAKVSQLELPSSKNWYEDEKKKYDSIYQLWRSLKPAIFISMPNSEKLKVWIYVYDTAGNKSNTIELNWEN